MAEVMLSLVDQGDVSGISIGSGLRKLGRIWQEETGEGGNSGRGRKAVVYLRDNAELLVLK